jgi:type IV secretory pathway TraG/TraD family ATPase VirD4
VKGGPVGFETIIRRMQASSAAEGAVRRAGGELERTFFHAPKTFENICGTIRSYIRWVEFQGIRRVMVDSTVDFRRLREERGTLFIVLPDDRLQTCSTWLRMICQSARVALQQTRSPNPMHFVLDEAAALGRFELILNAMRAWRGSGLKLHLVFQNVAQIKGTFGAEGYSAAMDGDVIQFLGSSDWETLDYISKMIGERDVVIPTVGTTTGWSESTTDTHGTSQSTNRGTNQSYGLSRSSSLSSSWSTGSSSSTSTTDFKTTVSHSTSSSESGSASQTHGSSENYGSSQGSSEGSNRSHATATGRTGGSSVSYTIQLRRAIRPEQLRMMPPEQSVVIAGHHEAMILYKEHYFGNPRLVLRAFSRPSPKSAASHTAPASTADSFALPVAGTPLTVRPVQSLGHDDALRQFYVNKR